MKKLVIALILLCAAPVYAALAVPMGYVWVPVSFNSSYDAQQYVARYSLDYGPQNVMLLTTNGDLKYLVVVRIQCGGCGSSSAYILREFASMEQATTEYNLQSAASVRGVFSTHDGRFVVYFKP